MTLFGVVGFPGVDATAGLTAAWIGAAEADGDRRDTGVDVPGPGLVDAPSPGLVLVAVAGLWSGRVAALAGLWPGRVLVAVAVNRVVLRADCDVVRVSAAVPAESGPAGGARPGVLDVVNSVLTCTFGDAAVVSDPWGRVVP